MDAPGHHRITPVKFLLISLAALAAAVVLAGCGGSSGESPSGAAGSPDTATACRATEELGKQILALKRIKVRTSTDMPPLVTGFDGVRKQFEVVGEQVEKLPPDAQQNWQQAESDFRQAFVDVGLDLTDAVSAKDPGAASEEALEKLTKSFDESFGAVDCP
jgi:ABC-type amino acid transport substrate-binding protein